jgi:hypothetical protein
MRHNPQSTLSIDHATWNRLLAAYVVQSPDGVNRFRYGQVTPADREALEGYIGELAAVAVSSINRSEQMAYWMNFYNALTIKVILDHYPVDSIRDIDISPGLFANGPWGKKLVRVEGEALSLDDMEHRILRPIWKDPRVHYGVNCASIGCPNLQPTAFTSDNLDAQLEAGARAYVNHPRGARVETGTLTVSSIYEWFKVDFGSSDAGVIDHLKRYANPGLLAALEKLDRISRDQYDWSLNDADAP